MDLATRQTRAAGGGGRGGVSPTRAARPSHGGDRMIRFDQVSKRYPSGHAALQELSFEVGAGEMVFVTGHSGAGKSTLLKLIALIERPSRGSVTVNGQNLAAVRARGVPAVRRGIGMVFQDHRLLMDRSVFDNVALPLVIAGLPREETAKRGRGALGKVGNNERGRLLPCPSGCPAKAASAALPILAAHQCGLRWAPCTHCLCGATYSMKRL